tara:strand:- start:499 stop:636 length:138 start_codon:yes stop_codon:yes gene_type:complete
LLKSAEYTALEIKEVAIRPTKKFLKNIITSLYLMFLSNIKKFIEK